MKNNTLVHARDTILVVEDEVLVRMALCEYLRECGYRVAEASSVAEATTLMGDPQLVIDVVFSSVVFAGKTEGFQLAQWTRQHHPGVNVILAGSLAGVVANAEQLCDESSIEKPYHAQEVLRRIRRLLASRPRKPQDMGGATTQEQS